MRSVRRARRPLVALLALVAALVVGYGVRSLSSDDSGPRPPTASASRTTGEVALSSLPAQVRQTLRLVRAGGAFPYPGHDGAVFRNEERRLPSRTTGYYREYTVPTPGSDDRGARRLIAGRGGEYYYTGDHYDTFRRVDVGR